MSYMEASVIICDYAQVNNGKMYIVGAAGNLLVTQQAEAPHAINAWAAILVAVPWHSHNQAHKLVVSLVDEDGHKIPLAHALPGAKVSPEDEGSVVGQFNAGRSPVMQAGDETVMPMAVPLQLQVPKLGGYRVMLEIDGTEIASARFRVVFPPSLGMPLAS
jgi:hypothetical protein